MIELHSHKSESNFLAVYVLACLVKSKDACLINFQVELILLDHTLETGIGPSMVDYEVEWKRTQDKL